MVSELVTLTNADPLPSPLFSPADEGRCAACAEAFHNSTLASGAGHEEEMRAVITADVRYKIIDCIHRCYIWILPWLSVLSTCSLSGIDGGGAGGSDEVEDGYWHIRPAFSDVLL